MQWFPGGALRGARVGCALVLATAALAGCDSYLRRAPTQPMVGDGPLPVVQLTVAPVPVVPIVSSDGAGLRLQLSATLTFTERAGGRGYLSALSSTLIMDAPDARFQTGLVTGMNHLAIEPLRSTSTRYDGVFGLTSGAQTLTWRVSASGLDGQGRPFNVPQVELPIVLPAALTSSSNSSSR